MRLLDKEYIYVKRYREISYVLIRNGFGYVVDKFGLRPFRSLRRKILRPRPLKEELHLLSEAERLRLVFEELGPTFIKFGQILSTRHDLVPEEYTRELSKLQDSVQPFGHSEAMRVIEKELERNIDEIFISFDPVPLAAASIGQVHHARLSGGEDVAVKVMRPGIEEIIEVDLSILMSMAKFAEKHIKEVRFFNPIGFVDEFSRVMRQEIDYMHEAQNADRFYANFKESTNIRIPKVYWKYTTKHILTLEFLEGTKVSYISQLEAMGIDKKKISTNLANAYLKMIFEDGFYHADPHPGNILISRDEVIIFLDFGMAGHVDPFLRENLINLMIATQRSYLNLLIETLGEIGLIGTDVSISPVLRVNLEEFIDKYYNLPTKFINPTTFLSDLIDVLIKSGGKIPMNIMLLSKTLILRDEISRRLDPEHNFGELVEPFVEKMIKERSSISYKVKETEKIMLDFINLIKDFPLQASHILKKAERGTFKIQLEHQGFEEIIEELDISSNRLSFSMIISSLIIGSSLLILTGISPSVLGMPWLGILGFFLAGLLGLGLIISILRSGRW